MDSEICWEYTTSCRRLTIMLDGINYSLRDNATGEIVPFGWDPLGLAPEGESPDSEDYKGELCDYLDKCTRDVLRRNFE